MLLPGGEMKITKRGLKQITREETLRLSEGDVTPEIQAKLDLADEGNLVAARAVEALTAFQDIYAQIYSSESSGGWFSEDINDVKKRLENYFDGYKRNIDPPD